MTDAGLIHLRGLTRLDYLDLADTQTTEAGRASLRRALPDCWILPEP